MLLTAADDDESEDESYAASKSGEDTESEEDTDKSIDKEERLGLEEDLKMPTGARKNSSFIKQVPQEGWDPHAHEACQGPGHLRSQTRWLVLEDLKFPLRHLCLQG